ncbi:hypothetical protein WJX73_009874 [Symbiochloris irregularis]|uniref:Uncharacterized protein n=1 Tax=Symbiochloris irregularis TaxID=706552 RepID=A0AAW1P1Y1_9CHLO
MVSLAETRSQESAASSRGSVGLANLLCTSLGKGRNCTPWPDQLFGQPEGTTPGLQQQHCLPSYLRIIYSELHAEQQGNTLLQLQNPASLLQFYKTFINGISATMDSLDDPLTHQDMLAHADLSMSQRANLGQAAIGHFASIDRIQTERREVLAALTNEDDRDGPVLQRTAVRMFEAKSLLTQLQALHAAEEDARHHLWQGIIRNQVMDSQQLARIQLPKHDAHVMPDLSLLARLIFDSLEPVMTMQQLTPPGLHPHIQEQAALLQGDEVQAEPEQAGLPTSPKAVERGPDDPIGAGSRGPRHLRLRTSVFGEPAVTCCRSSERAPPHIQEAACQRQITLSGNLGIRCQARLM